MIRSVRHLRLLVPLSGAGSGAVTLPFGVRMLNVVPLGWCPRDARRPDWGSD
jgi:hypothetical protein